MKKNYFIIIAILAIAIGIAVFYFGKGKLTKEEVNLDYQDDPSEIVDAQKACYAAQVLVVLDSLAAQWSDFAAKEPSPISVVLTDKEKLVQPDYLLDPSAVNTLVTKNQKVRTLAILLQDRAIKLAYGMPVSDCEVAIAKLAVDLNFPMTAEELINKELTFSENISMLYTRCRENLELESFWEFCGATLNETDYIIANNPDLYLGKINQDTWSNYNKIWDVYVEASDELGKYDSEMAMINEMLHRDSVLAEGEDLSVFDNIDSAKAFFHKTLDRMTSRRNHMLTD